MLEIIKSKPPNFYFQKTIVSHTKSQFGVGFFIISYSKIYTHYTLKRMFSSRDKEGGFESEK